jgi:hypothetical protein
MEDFVRAYEAGNLKRVKELDYHLSRNDASELLLNGSGLATRKVCINNTGSNCKLTCSVLVVAVLSTDSGIVQFLVQVAKVKVNVVSDVVFANAITNVEFLRGTKCVPLYFAIQHADLGMVKCLLEHGGVDPNFSPLGDSTTWTSSNVLFEESNRAFQA